MISPIRHPLLESPCTRHGFFTRDGGVSEGIYQGLNCGPGSADNPDHIDENRRLVGQAISGDDKTPLMTTYQIHSTYVVTVDQPWAPDNRPRVDAMVTNKTDIILGVLTADCAPVLFSDPIAGIIGAAHAGWKGAVGGVLENTISAMEKLGARRSNIKTVVGPCIARDSYEVGRDFVKTASAADFGVGDFLTSGKDRDHFQFDLQSYVLARMEMAGLGASDKLPLDTYPKENRFFSYRRTTHLGEPDYGRQISAIMISKQ